MPDFIPEKLPFGKKIIYSLGQLGWSLCAFGAMNLLYYFYDSPKNNEGNYMFPTLIISAAILGIIAGVSRFFDAVTDPLIAGWSDRSESKLGRRRKFMAVGGFPFALFSVLVFIPPFGPGTLNLIWIFVSILLFYFFMTMYVTPFFALISELGHTTDERLQLSTMISITWALGFMGGNSIYAVQGLIEKSIFQNAVSVADKMAASQQSFQIAIIVFAIISLVLLYLPVIFIDEKKYCEPHVSEEGSFQALASAFKNKNFRMFTFSDLTYFLALTFIQSGISFYVIQLLGLDKSMATTCMLILFLCSFIFYIPISIIAKKTGKKKLLSFAFIFFAICFFLMSFWGKFPIDPEMQAFIISAAVGIPMAIFGILPNAIVADIAESDGIQSGNYKAGIFFGARTFMSKVGASITLLLFPLITHIGSGKDGGATEFGIRMTIIAGTIFLIIGLLIFLKYDEKEIQQILSTKEKTFQ